MKTSHKIKDEFIQQENRIQTDPQLLLEAADRCFASHDYAGAWQNLNLSAEENGGSFEIFCAMAMCSMSMNDLDRARLEYLRAIRYNPDNPEARLNLAVVEKSLGLLNDAYHQTQIVLGLNPDDHLARRLAGDINVQRGLFKLALVEYSQVLRHTPDDISVLMGYGRTLFSLGEFEKALGVYEKILELDPSHEIAADNMLIVRKKMGGSVNRPFKGDRKKLLEEAQWAINQGDHKSAKAILRPLIFSSDISADICFVYANICCLDRNYEEALVNYTKMADLDPTDIRAHIRICLTACLTGLAELARLHFIKAQKIDASHPDLLEAEVDLLMLEKKFLPAAQLIYRTISSDMSRTDLLIKLGQCFENLGDFNIAHETYLRVLANDPSNESAQSSLKRIEHRVTNSQPQDQDPQSDTDSDISSSPARTAQVA